MTALQPQILPREDPFKIHATLQRNAPHLPRLGGPTLETVDLVIWSVRNANQNIGKRETTSDVPQRAHFGREKGCGGAWWRGCRLAGRRLNDVNRRQLLGLIGGNDRCSGIPGPSHGAGLHA